VPRSCMKKRKHAMRHLNFAQIRRYNFSLTNISYPKTQHKQADPNLALIRRTALNIFRKLSQYSFFFELSVRQFRVCPA
jgi:hypothetical protein